jgi:putative tryptophan/tyrosine transport system substrate-binding protein
MISGKSPTRRLVLAAGGLAAGGLAAGAALLLPRAARAQTAQPRRIAYLGGGSRSLAEPYLEMFRQELRALGYGDEDITIGEYFAQGEAERLPGFAAELVGLAPDVIVAGSVQALEALKLATGTIPIVVPTFADPMATGFVASLAHPGGNVTGLSLSSPEMAGKWLDLLKTAIPDAGRIAILVNPANSQNAVILQVVQQVARTLRIELLPVEARTPNDVDDAFAAIVQERAEALIVSGDPVFNVARRWIVKLAARGKLAAIYPLRDYSTIGGLMSYGLDLTDNFRRAGTYVDKILKGAKPADLPVGEPSKFELVVNLRTAQKLGLTFPPSILSVAEVIE